MRKEFPLQNPKGYLGPICFPRDIHLDTQMFWSAAYADDYFLVLAAVSSYQKCEMFSFSSNRLALGQHNSS